jgi:hypothetical protein
MDVEAIELYRGPELPIQFGSSSCVAVGLLLVVYLLAH